MDINSSGLVNQMFFDYFGEDLPACSYIQASALPSPTALIEVEAIASLKDIGLQKVIAQ